MVGTSRRISTPGVSVGTMNMDARCGGARVGVGDGHDDQEVGDRGVGGEPLAPVDHPLVAIAHGARAQLRGIGAGRVGLGHAERAAQVAGEQRVQPALLLIGRPRQREDLRVARVGRRVAERQRRDRRAAEDLVHQPEAHLAHALPAELGGQVRCPQAAGLDLLLQRRDRARAARRVPARARSPPAARSRRGRSRSSSRAALESPDRWRSPSP